ncbi:MAG: hypothetical protein KC421_26630, partial [Anaerolineales bacterium]|nr:hypothetical protein [Anaerolineales bacterium]
IPASEFAVGEPLVSFISSVGNGGDDGVDDNLNENGADQLDPAMTGVSSAIVNLVPGSEPTGETGQGSYGGTLADADVDMSIDFGFFELLTLGNRVWFDADNNGIIDDGSNPGAANVVMNLLDQNGDPVLHPITGLPITTTTTVDGYYLFTGLLPGDYIVQVAPENFQPGGVLEFFLNSTGSADPDDDVDSDDNGNDGANLAADGVSCDPVTLDYDLEPDNNLDTDDNNNTNLSVDFGFYLDPTAVTLISFTAVSQQAKSVQITWQTGAEIDNYGFELWRSKEGVWETAVKIHTEPAVGTGTGAIYRYQDSVPANGTWYYWLVDVDTNDVKATHGPVSVVVKPLYQLFMPIVVR